MGWGRWLILGDISQQLDISDQKRELERMRGELHARRLASKSTGARLDRLQEENEELKLYMAALIRLVLDGDNVRGEQRIDMQRRIRDVLQLPDGALAAISDDKRGELLRLTPVSDK